MLARNKEESEMTSANQTIRKAGEDVGDFARDVGRMASKQYDRAQDMAIDAFDETHAAIRHNPLLSIAIALGIGFLLGALTGVRR